MKNVGEQPKHYRMFPDSELEAIHVIKYALTPEEYMGYLKGNALKYRLRIGKKDEFKKEMNKIRDYENELEDFYEDYMAEVSVPSGEPMDYRSYEDESPNLSSVLTKEEIEKLSSDIKASHGTFTSEK